MITLSTASLYPYGLERIFSLAKEAGFKGLELMLRSKTDNAYYDTWDVSYVKHLSKKYKLLIRSIHVPFEFENNPCNFKDIIKVAKAHHVKNIIVHIPRLNQSDYIKWYKKEAHKFANNQTTILFENVHYKKTLADPIVSYDQLNKIPNICFDIAHSERSGADTINIVKNLNNIKQFHVSLWNGKEDHLGITTKKDFFKKVLSFHKNADYCLELCPKAFNDVCNQKEVIRILKENLNFLKKIT